MTDPVRILDVPETRTQPAVDELFQQMIDAESDVMDFHMHRDPEVDRTFSAEGLQDVTHALSLFVGARVAARFDPKRGFRAGTPGPSDMHVEVKITLDDKTFEVPAVVRPWYAVDGKHRGGG